MVVWYSRSQDGELQNKFFELPGNKPQVPVCFHMYNKRVSEQQQEESPCYMRLHNVRDVVFIRNVIMNCRDKVPFYL